MKWLVYEIFYCMLQASLFNVFKWRYLYIWTVLVIRSFGSDKTEFYKHKMIIYYTKAVQWNTAPGEQKAVKQAVLFCLIGAVRAVRKSVQHIIVACALHIL